MNGFLLKKGVDPLSCLSDESREIARHFLFADGALTSVADASEIPADGELLLITMLTRPSRPPEWESLLADLFPATELSPNYSKANGAIVSVRLNDSAPSEGPKRWVAWAFGSASRSLVRRRLEPRFGLFIALNRIARADGGGLRQLEYRSFGAYRQRTGHTAGRDTPLEGFRIDPLVDLLSGVGGRTGEGSGEQVYGGRALRLRVPIATVADFRVLATQAVKDYRDDFYKQTQLSFVDDFVPVEDAGELDKLGDRLVELVLSGSDRIDAFFPDDLVGYEGPQAVYFVVLPGERASNPSRTTLTPSNLATSIGNAGREGLSRSLRFLDSAAEFIDRATVLDCVAADFEYGGSRFVVSDGDFYRVDPAFIDAIDADLANIPDSDLSFPTYTSGEEGKWLRQTGKDVAGEFVCLDQELVRLAGETPFEAADLVHMSGALVHAKRRKGGSQALSYVMVQARRSCQMLTSVPAAREQLAGFVMTHTASRAVADRVISALAMLEKTPPGLDVVLLMLGHKPRRGLAGLPLLAKLELSETARQIGQMGFALSVAQVGV